MTAQVRPIRPDDVPTLLRLIRELAEYEREPEAVGATEDDLRAALFGPAPQVFAHVAESDGTVVGAAVWSVSFSTWTGRHGIALIDLIVSASARRGGHGAALFGELAALCVRRGYTRLDWDVLDALENGGPDGRPGPQGFYRRNGGAPRPEWTGWRLDGDALARLGSS